jgi:hypothetical protein
VHKLGDGERILQPEQRWELLTEGVRVPPLESLAHVSEQRRQRRRAGGLSGLSAGSGAWERMTELGDECVDGYCPSTCMVDLPKSHLEEIHQT